jgi:hypothetical protein
MTCLGPKTTIVKTKWEKCDLNTYQSTITDGVVQVLQNSIRNIEEAIIAMEEFMHTACNKTIEWVMTCLGVRSHSYYHI